MSVSTTLNQDHPKSEKGPAPRPAAPLPPPITLWPLSFNSFDNPLLLITWLCGAIHEPSFPLCFSYTAPQHRDSKAPCRSSCRERGEIRLRAGASLKPVHSLLQRNVHLSSPHLSWPNPHHLRPHVQWYV